MSRNSFRVGNSRRLPDAKNWRGLNLNAITFGNSNKVFTATGICEEEEEEEEEEKT